MEGGERQAAMKHALIMYKVLTRDEESWDKFVFKHILEV